MQDGILILIPQPDDLVAHMAGLHRDVWSSTDTDAYLRESATHGRIHLPTAVHDVIALDTSIFIYHEAHPRYVPLARVVLARINQGLCTTVISVLVL
ncbi:MAG: hypothetical protein R2838_25130 [Caldilineaceae bacterium]